jgi:lipoprotein-anchoring transpeptidase ErfK/SrfK
MIRRSGAFLLMLPLAMALPAASVFAQTNQQPYYRSTAPQQLAQQNRYGKPSRILPFEQGQAEPAPPAYFTPQPRYGQQPDAADSNPPRPPQQIGPPQQVGPAPDATPAPVPPSATAALPPEDQPEQGPPQELPPNLQKQLVDFRTKEPAGTIIIDTANTYLYYVLGHGQAIRYGIGVGREGFTWSGTERISKMKEWPDWFPPKEMIDRQPYLPRMMAGGPGNPLGARALYLGHTLYRIHGTNQPSTIGKTVSSGCIRLLNKDIEDLYSRVQVGSRVVVLPDKSPSQPVAERGVAPGSTASAHAPAPARSGTAISGAPLPPIR